MCCEDKISYFEAQTILNMGFFLYECLLRHLKAVWHVGRFFLTCLPCTSPIPGRCPVSAANTLQSCVFPKQFYDFSKGTLVTPLINTNHRGLYVM